MSLVSILDAIKRLRSDEIVAIPTETVYGLAGKASSTIAVQKIFQLKGRPTNRPLIIHYGKKDLWHRDTIWTDDAELLARNFWPGPLTLLLDLNPKAEIASEAVGFTKSIAVRRSASQIMEEICDNVGPLAAPSVNRYQQLSTTTYEDAVMALNIPTVQGPRCAVGLESTIIDLRVKPYSICRVGAISIEDISRFVDVSKSVSEMNLPGSGAHYRPSKPLRVNATSILPGEAALNFGKETLHALHSMNLSVVGDINEAAYNLYHALSELSQTTCTGIAVAPIPLIGVGIAINDKLNRAKW